MQLPERMQENWTKGAALMTWLGLGAASAAGVLWETGLDVLPGKMSLAVVLFGALVGAGIGFYAEFGRSRLARCLAWVGLPWFVVQSFVGWN